MADAEQPRKGNAVPRSADELRRHAEELVDRLADAQADSASTDDTAVTLHELRVHQIELEMQNDELRRTQLELDAQRAQYFDLFDLAPVGSLILSAKSIVENANLTAARLLGVDRRLLVGQPFSAFISAEDQDAYYLLLQEMKRNPEPRSSELRMRRLSGRPDIEDGDFWALLKVEPVDSGLEETGGIRIAFADITERKQSEKALRDSEAKFRRLFESIEQGMALHEIITDDDGKPVDYVYLDLNDSYTKLLGVTREALGKRITEVMPKVEEYWIRNFGEVAQTGAPSYYEDYLETTGRYYATYAYSPKKNQFAVLVTDITDRKIVAKALQESDARYSSMIANISDVIGIMGADGIMKYKSPNIEKWFGWKPQDLVGTDGWQTVHPDDVERLQAEFAALLERDGAAATVEYKYLCKDGSCKPVELTATNLVNDPSINGVLLNYRDITERRQMEASREQDLRRLTQALASTVDIVSEVAETRDPYTAGHQRRVSELAVRIADAMGMSPEQTDEIRIASLLHDIGKMSVPAEILSKPGKLAPIEFELIKAHSEAGYQIISAAHMEGPVAEIVYQHHERCDGSGYPRGLGADDLLPASKVIAVADVVEAMVSHRPYRSALGVDAALAEIERGAGLQYDADVCEACVRLFREEEFAFSAV